MGLIFLLLIPIGLCYHVSSIATERGRSASAWIFLVILATVAGAVVGSAGEWWIEREARAPALLALFVNPAVLGCVLAIAAVLLLHRLPVGAARLEGTQWEFDRLGAGERVELSVRNGVAVRSKSGELLAGAGDVIAVRTDGECLVLDCGAEIGKLVLCPVGLPSREVRMRFVEALHERIQKS